MYCNNCGEKIPEAVNFCPKCGTKISSNITGETKKNNIPVIIAGIVGLCVVIGLVIMFVNRKPTINLNHYFSIDVSGFDSRGRAKYIFDEDALTEDYGDIIGKNYKKTVIDEYGLLNDEESLRYYSVQSMIMECIDGSLDRRENLSNGDKITYTWNCDDDLAMERYGVRLKYSDFEVDVNQLTAVEKVNPFEGINVSFSGYTPNGHAEIVKDSNNKYAQELSYRISQSDDLKNGDTLTVYVVCTSLDPEYFEKEYGIVLTETQKEYTVSGLSSYISSSGDIDEEMMNQLLDEAQKTVSQKMPDKNMQYIGNYWLSLTDDCLGYDRNFLLLIYRENGQGDYYIVSIKNIAKEDAKVVWENVTIDSTDDAQEYADILQLSKGLDIYETNICNNSGLFFEEAVETPANIELGQLTESQQNMYYVMDALAETCYYQTYDPNDADFFWSALDSLICCNPERWAEEDSYMGWRVEKSKLEQYAAGLFEEYHGLREIPESDYPEFKQDGDSYVFMIGDRGMEHTEITSWIIEDDGTNTVIMDLIDDMDNEIYATYSFVLVPNPQLKVDKNQVFQYSVRSVSVDKKD